MNFIRHAILPLTLLTASVSAQCYEADFGTLLGDGDDVLFATQPMNISFPMGGVFANYTHIAISTNGVAFLWNAATSVPGASTIGHGQLTDLRGGGGSSPRIAPMWEDLNLLASNGGGVWLNNTIPGKCVITWANAVEFGVNQQPFTVQAQLLSTGEVRFYYADGAMLSLAMIVGVSQGGGIAAPGAVNLSAGGNGIARIMYEQFAANAFDLQGLGLSIVPTFLGYTEAAAAACTPARHDAYGAGCYDIGSGSCYQMLVDAAAAAPVLTNQSMRFVAGNGGFTAQWGGATYVPPTLAALLVFSTPTDDGEETIAPSQPFPSPDGPQSLLRVHSNGIVSWGSAPQTFPGPTGVNPFTPDPAVFLAAANGAIWSWHDYNEAELGSGRILWEQVTLAGHPVLCVTWNDVESFANPELVNRSTMQIQLDLSTGDAAIVWGTIDNHTTSIFGSAHLVGYSRPGPSLDPGSIVLATALPVTISQDVHVMKLSASPTPISTGSGGTLVTYTHENVPESAPGSNLHFGVTILSFGDNVIGLDLGPIGMPGCRLHLASLDDTRGFVGGAGQTTLTTQFFVPSGVPAGTMFFAQTAAIIAPNSLTNGQNALGLTLSNAVRSVVNAY